MLTIAEARARRTPIDWRPDDIAVPSFTGLRVLDDYPLINDLGANWSILWDDNASYREAQAS